MLKKNRQFGSGEVPLVGLSLLSELWEFIFSTSRARDSQTCSSFPSYRLFSAIWREKWGQRVVPPLLPSRPIQVSFLTTNNQT